MRESHQSLRRIVRVYWLVSRARTRLSSSSLLNASGLLCSCRSFSLQLCFAHLGFLSCFSFNLQATGAIK